MSEPTREQIAEMARRRQLKRDERNREKQRVGKVNQTVVQGDQFSMTEI